MHPIYTLRDIVHGHLQRAREQPADLLLRPGIKAVVIIGLLTVAAQVSQERSPRPQDAREALGRLKGREGAGDNRIREAIA